MIKQFFIFFTIVTLCESCYVLEISGSPKWNASLIKGKKNVGDFKIENTELTKHRVVCPFPFLLVSWYNKDYGLSMNLFSKDTIYERIDSIQYSITTLDNKVVSENMDKLNCNFYTYKHNQPSQSCYFETPYKLNIPKQERTDELTLNCKLYLLNKINETVVKDYKIELKKIKKKKITGEWFRG